MHEWRPSAEQSSSAASYSDDATGETLTIVARAGTSQYTNPVSVAFAVVRFS
jgi:hypothetical protein